MTMLPGGRTTAKAVARFAVPASDEWMTPPEIVRALGPFDLDPCTTADNWLGIPRYYSIADDGLEREWEGRVWLNPPYSNAAKWVQRLSEHGYGTALVFARVETRWWQKWVWGKGAAVLFFAGRVSFIPGHPDLQDKGHNAGAPSALIAYGAHDAERLRMSFIRGVFVDRWSSRS